MLDITALQTQWKAVRTDYDAIDEQWRKKKEEPAKAEEPAQPRRGIEAGKLKGMDVDATAEAVERIGTLFHDTNPRNTKSRSQTRRG